MYQIKSLRDFFIPPNRAIETSRYPGYVIRLQKGRQIQAKKNVARKSLHQKIYKKTMSQLNKLLTKDIGNFCVLFSNDQRTAHYCDTVKKNLNQPKGAKMRKSKFFFYENWLY